MNFKAKREMFEKEKRIYDSCKLTFLGVADFDVYNPSLPFKWGGKEYLFGRIEKRHEWARSWVRLFENSGYDEWTLVPNTMIYQLEDPFIAIIGDELVLGGVHVRYQQSKIDKYNTYFYRGTDLNNLYYFTTGPDNMKDIRLVELTNNQIGVFSRPKNEQIKKLYNTEAIVGFTTINNLDELNEEVIENAKYIPNLFSKGEWGGCNQAYQLESGLIGVIGHKCYQTRDKNKQNVATYTNITFVFDPIKHEVIDISIIGTRNCYPQGPTKKPSLIDCAFTSGIIPRENGVVDLFSGLSDCEVGRIVIDNPFQKYGKIVAKQKKLTLKR